MIIREQIVQAVIDRLRPLTTVPVLRREQYEDEFEFVCVWDQTQETSRDDYGRLTHTMDLTVEFIRQDASGYASPAAAVSGMYGDLVRTLFNDPLNDQPDPTFGGLALCGSEPVVINAFSIPVFLSCLCGSELKAIESKPGRYFLSCLCGSEL